MRVHGDLHVGQVLRSAGDPVPTYLVTDFDGNPVLAAEDRLREQPAALDVAGMLQSLRHVALVLRRHDPGQDPATAERMSRALCREFLETYRARLARASLAALLDERLLDAYSLRQVCREFSYAAVHLPRWSYVPEAALPALLAVRR
jgi:maltokinase